MAFACVLWMAWVGGVEGRGHSCGRAAPCSEGRLGWSKWMALLLSYGDELLRKINQGRHGNVQGAAHIVVKAKRVTNSEKHTRLWTVFRNIASFF